MKNFDLNCKDLEEYLVETTYSKEGTVKGVEYTFHFDNGLGVSIIKHKFVRGYKEDLWALWTLKQTNEGWIVDPELINPILYVTDANLRNYLQQIKEL